LFVALGGTSAWAADKITSGDIARNAVHSKHIKRNAVETAEIADHAVTADKLAKDAGTRFAYIRDGGGAETADVAYGRGVKAVSDPAGDSSYRLTFDRSLKGCVVQATPGYGNPAGSANVDEEATPLVAMENGNEDQADVFFEDAVTITPIDTSFLVTAAC